MYIVLEGIDNAGKSTVASILKQRLEESGRNVTISKELTSSVGKLILHSFQKKQKLSPELKTYLFAADRLIRQEAIASEDADIVVWDRYTYSALVYREMEGINVGWVRDVNLIFRKPDLAYYLDVSIEESIRRGELIGKPCPYTMEQLGLCRKIYKKYVLDGYLTEIKSQEIESTVSCILRDVENTNVQ